MSSSRQLAAIMFTDIVGYTALMGRDEQKAFELLKKNREIQKPIIDEFNGKFVKELGDGILASFPTVSDALFASIKIQQACSASKQLSLRIGIHQGEIIFENNDIYGDAVNIASRIQTLGIPGSILFSKKVTDEIKNKAEFQTLSLGSFEFKNVNEPIEVFALANDGFPVPKRSRMEGKLKKKDDQKRKVFAIILLTGIVVAAIFIYKNNLEKNEKKEIFDKSIAVLPFVDMNVGKDQEYFSDGLSEELLNLLSKIQELKVIGRTSSFSFKGKNEDLRIIGEKLGVASLLEGSVKKEGNNIRVRAQLIRAADGSQLWSETYEGNLAGIFKLQDEIAAAVVKELKIKLLAVPKSATPQINLEVYNLILQGNYFSEKRDKENLAKALDFYRRALAIDSLNARSWAGLARCYNIQSIWGWIDRNQGYENAREAATKALALGDDMGEVHLVLGAVNMYHDFDWDRAEAEFQKALSLEPGNADVLRTIGFLYRCIGRYDDAIRLTKQSLTLDPVKAITYFNFGTLLHYANRLEEAIVSYKKVMELNLQFPRIHLALGEVYLFQGKPEMALAEMLQETERDIKEFGIAVAYHALGRRKEADEALTNYIANYQNERAYLIARIYAFRGQKDKSFEWIEKAYIRKENGLAYMKGDPLLKNLEDDTRYSAFLKRMNFPKD